jgi:hypothetical protein
VPKPRSPSPVASEASVVEVCDTPLSGPSAWYALESRIGVRRGDGVPPPDRQLRRGRRGLSEYNTGLFVCAVDILKSDRSSLLSPVEASGPNEAEKPRTSSDARTLAIASTASGRHWDFRELSELCEEEVFDD